MTLVGDARSRTLRRVAVVLGAVVMWVGAVTATPTSWPTRTWILDMARYLTAEVFVVAGVVHLAAWRSTRSCSALRSAVGLATVGMTLPALAVLTPWTIDGLHISAAAPFARLLVFVPVLYTLGATDRPALLRIVGTRREFRPARALPVFAVLLAPAAALALLIGTAPSLASPHTGWTGLGAAGELGLAAGWGLLAARSRRASATPPDVLGWPTIAMVLMASGELLRGVTITTIGITPGIAPGCALLAAVVFLHDAGTQLRRVQRAETDETRELSSALTRTRQLLERLEQGQRERLHDVRSAVVGVIGASRLLTGPATALDDDREALQRLIAAELTRLQTVLDVDSAEPVTDFDLDAVLGPVLLAHRIEAGGTGLTAEVGRVRCTGRPAATATVLDNLLGNARRHAPGAQVWVRTSEDADHVTVVVEDDGPGIPTAERPLVLRPGVRGSTAVAPGTGLGLANCARTVDEQGGTLRLSGRPGGGTRVTFTLPTAHTTRRPLHALAS